MHNYARVGIGIRLIFVFVRSFSSHTQMQGPACPAHTKLEVKHAVS